MEVISGHSSFKEQCLCRKTGLLVDTDNGVVLWYFSGIINKHKAAREAVRSVVLNWFILGVCLFFVSSQQKAWATDSNIQAPALIPTD